jgi:hypothetical protein
VSEPRLSLSDDGLTLHIGFTDSPDTILWLERFEGEYKPYDVNAGRGDMKQLREWVVATREALGYPAQDT